MRAGAGVCAGAGCWRGRLVAGVASSLLAAGGGASCLPLPFLMPRPSSAAAPDPAARSSSSSLSSSTTAMRMRRKAGGAAAAAPAPASARAAPATAAASTGEGAPLDGPPLPQFSFSSSELLSSTTQIRVRGSRDVGSGGAGATGGDTRVALEAAFAEDLAADCFGSLRSEPAAPAPAFRLSAWTWSVISSLPAQHSMGMAWWMAAHAGGAHLSASTRNMALISAEPSLITKLHSSMAAQISTQPQAVAQAVAHSPKQ